MTSRKRGSNGSTVVSTVVGASGRQKKPAKPYPEFPLYAHAGGVWAKRIRGRERYFGPWGDPDGALERYLREKDFLFAGVEPPHDVDGVTLDEVVNRYLTHQIARHASGEISLRQLADCKRDGKRILDCLGRTRPAATLRPADFARLRAAAFTGVRGRNATTATNILIRQRSVFKWAAEAKLIEAVDYGGAFHLPSARARRKALSQAGPRLIDAADIRRMLDACQAAPWGQLLNLRAMILLAINCGLGNTDCAELRFEHLNLDGRVLDYLRPKTQAPRRAVLWKETAEAITAALARRAKLVERRPPAEVLADRVFLTKRRRPYVSMSPAGKLVDSVGLEFRRLAGDLGIRRKGIGFYALRHTFQTVADEMRDFPAIDLVMGHMPAGEDMAARYRERIGDERLAAVAEHVRAWMFGRAPHPRRGRKPGRETR